MIPCFAIDDIITPKKFVLRGLWFGPKKPKCMIVWVHGLSSSAFSMMHVVGKIADNQTAVLTFNNRGFEKVADVKRIVGRKAKWVRAGATHEVFTDCADDIQGTINYARRTGVKNIYLAGHSTGCQKSIYWAYKKKSRGVKGIILLAPVSDYAAALKNDRNGKLSHLTNIARRLVRSGKEHQLMSASILNDGSLNDAQRFLSLNTPNSIEAIFPYEQKEKRPRLLHTVKKPLLVLWAQNDEYADRPAKQVVAWFEQHMPKPHKIVIVPGVKHSFSGAEWKVAREIKKFIDA